MFRVFVCCCRCCFFYDYSLSFLCVSHCSQSVGNSICAMCIPFGRPLKNVVELAQFRKLWIFVEANAARALTQPYAPSNLQISFVLYCARDLFNDSAPSTDFLLILRSVRVRAKKTTDDFFLSFFLLCRSEMKIEPIWCCVSSRLHAENILSVYV